MSDKVIYLLANWSVWGLEIEIIVLSGFIMTQNLLNYFVFGCEPLLF